MENKKEYTITQEQINLIGHFKRMIELNCELLKHLCDDSTKNRLEIGFELGKIYSNLNFCHNEMIDFEIEIRDQKNNE